jgi:hypothetical protein
MVPIVREDGDILLVRVFDLSRTRSAKSYLDMYYIELTDGKMMVGRATCETPKLARATRGVWESQ